jgi:23S rRNA G2445 N2-methylase RlmL
VADRRFGFERWPGHRPQQLEAARAEAAARATPERPLHLFGSELDQAALGAARANAERAGVADALALTRADAAALDNPAPDAGPGVLVCNPPYGARLSEAEALVPLYRELGEALRGGFPGWDAWMLLAEPMHRDALGLTPAETWPLRNGPLQIRGVRFRIPGARPEPTGGDHDRAAQ